MAKTRYDFSMEIDELFDKALKTLTQEEYEKLLDDVSQMLAERE